MTLEEYIWYAKREAAEKAAEEATQNAQIQSILELLEDYGEIPEDLKTQLQKADTDTLKKYLKLAAKAESIEDFLVKAGLEKEIY